MKTRWLCNGLLLLTVFFLGFIVSKAFDVPGITIDTNINPLHALSIIVTLLIALLITVYFQTNKEVNNVANGIIIKRIDKIIDIIDSLHDSIIEENITTSSAPSTVKRIHTSLKYISTSLSDQEIKVSVEFNDLEIETRKINDLLTNTPADNSNTSVSPVTVTSGNMSIVKQEFRSLKSILKT